VEATSPHIFKDLSAQEFESLALDLFRLQASAPGVYGSFVKHLGLEADSVKRLEDIPFLPVEFFKTHTISTGSRPAEIVFSSSGTTGSAQSRHYVSDLDLYRGSFTSGFRHFYGEPSDYALLALLPSYLEREGSSLVLMVEELIRASAHPKSGFYLHNYAELRGELEILKASGQKTLLIGVSFALLDFAEQFQMEFPELIVMETGGMKGRRKELIREELHDMLKKGFGVISVHSEYGMTELLSQAYSKGEGLFRCPPWMRVLTKDSYDPLSGVPYGATGSLYVIDLANRNSCAFLATQDLGRCFENGTFEVLGRFDNSDIRGCNLLLS
jgi:phenylacetate-coenzyme A ligase PaaK-like adenylate-forming protein